MDGGVFVTGLGTSLGLIVAIGAQNAFVLRQGIRREHVLAVSLACALSDAVLILAGVAGFGRLVVAVPWLGPVLRLGGAAFLGWYALRALRAALGPGGTLDAQAGGPPRALAPVLATCLALTWLNPHVYLDTLVLLGSVSTRFPGARASFAAGAMTGSLLFFLGLGFGARLLRPVFARPVAWRMLDGAIAVVMALVAVQLLRGA